MDTLPLSRADLCPNVASSSRGCEAAAALNASKGAYAKPVSASNENRQPFFWISPRMEAPAPAPLKSPTTSRFATRLAGSSGHELAVEGYWRPVISVAEASQRG